MSFCSFSLALLGQEWEELADFEERTDWYEQYYDSLLLEKGDLKNSSYINFLRYQSFWEERLEGSDFYESQVFDIKQEQAEIFAGSPDYNPVQTLSYKPGNEWKELGPANYPMTGTKARGIGLNTFIKFHPWYNNEGNKIIFTGGPSGLWKTVDNGEHWELLNTDQLQENSVADVIIDPLNDKHLIIASGNNSKLFQSLSIFGSPYKRCIGLYESFDGGKSWNFLSDMGIKKWENRRVSKLLVHPLDPEVYIACTFKFSWKNGAAWRGQVLRSDDKGKTWKEVYSSSSSSILDAEFAAGSKDILFVSGNQDIVKIESLSNSDQNSWKISNITDRLQGVEYNIEPKENHTVLFELATSFDCPECIYVLLIPGAGIKDKEVKGADCSIWVSKDLGSSFEKLKTVLYRHRGALAYKSAFEISNENQNLMWLGGIGFEESKDGGMTFINIQGSNNSSFIHDDVRAIGKPYKASSVVAVATDAGFHLSTNSGETWENRSLGLGVGRVHYVSSFIQNDSLYAITGMQDVSSNYFNGSTWEQIPSANGDGTVCKYLSSKDDYLFSDWGGNIRWNSGTRKRTVLNLDRTSKKEKRSRFNFPLEKIDDRTLLTGAQNLYKIQLGEKIEVTKQTDFDWVNGEDKSIRAIERVEKRNKEYTILAYNEGKKKDRKVYGQLYYDWKGKGKWKDITPKGKAWEGTYQTITSVLIDPKKTKKIWMTLSGYQNKENTPNTWNNNKVFHSSDGGKSWAVFTQGLPEMGPVNKILMDTSSNDRRLYLATDYGVFTRCKYDSKWSRLGSSLPNTPVTWIEFNQNKILAATYGRGVWVIDLD